MYCSLVLTPAAACHRSGEESGGGGASLSNAAEAAVAATLFKVAALCVASLQSVMLTRVKNALLNQFLSGLATALMHGRSPAAALIQQILAILPML